MGKFKILSMINEIKIMAGKLYPFNIIGDIN